MPIFFSNDLFFSNQFFPNGKFFALVIWLAPQVDPKMFLSDRSLAGVLRLFWGCIVAVLGVCWECIGGVLQVSWGCVGVLGLCSLVQACPLPQVILGVSNKA